MKNIESAAGENYFLVGMLGADVRELVLFYDHTHSITDQWFRDFKRWYTIAIKKKAIAGLDFNLTVSIFKQGGVYVAFTPALDISTYGKTTQEAQNNFEELVNVFFAEFDDERKLAHVLESLGWSKHKTTWSPPEEVEHIQKSFSIPAYA